MLRRELFKPPIVRSGLEILAWIAMILMVCPVLKGCEAWGKCERTNEKVEDDTLCPPNTSFFCTPEDIWSRMETSKPNRTFNLSPITAEAQKSDNIFTVTLVELSKMFLVNHSKFRGFTVHNVNSR